MKEELVETGWGEKVRREQTTREKTFHDEYKHFDGWKIGWYLHIVLV